jgi:hypothetical protein
MAFTQSDVETLEEAIRTSITDGTWRVQTHTFDDQSTTFRTLKEATDFLAWMKSQVQSASAPRTRFAAHSKGRTT